MILFITFTVAWVEIMYMILKAVKSTLLKVNFVEIFVTIVSVIILVIHGQIWATTGHTNKLHKRLLNTDLIQDVEIPTFSDNSQSKNNV